MRKIEEIQIQIETITERLKEITCNKCGKKLCPRDSDKYVTSVDYIEADFTEFNAQFGHGSKRDGEKWEFDLCDKCANKLLDWLSIKPDIKQTINIL